MPKKGDTIRVTTKTGIYRWPDALGIENRQTIDAGRVFVGEMVMNTSDSIKLKVGDDYFDFNRSDIKIEMVSPATR